MADIAWAAVFGFLIACSVFGNQLFSLLLGPAMLPLRGWTAQRGLYYITPPDPAAIDTGRLAGSMALVGAVAACACLACIRGVARMRAVRARQAEPACARRAVGAAVRPDSSARRQARPDHKAPVAPLPARGLRSRLARLARRGGQVLRNLHDQTFHLRPASVVKVSAAILLLWIPVMVAAGPFSIGPDTVAQLMWSQGMPAFDPSSRHTLTGFAMSDHHPVVDTLLYGAFYDLGRLLGAWWVGMVLFMVVQALALAVSLGYCCCWMGERRLPAACPVLAFAFWSLYPLIPMAATTIVKDMTSMPFLVAWAPLFVDGLSDAFAGRRQPAGRIAASAALVLLGSLTRKTLIYVYAPCCVLLALIALLRAGQGRAERAASLLVPALPALAAVFFVMPAVVLPALKAAPAGRQEMLGVPIAQVAYIARTDPQAITPAERDAIARVLPYDRLVRNVGPFGADSVKDLMARSSTREDAGAFLRAWAQIAARRPQEALAGSGYLRFFWTFGTADFDILAPWWGWERKGSRELFPGWRSSRSTKAQLRLNGFMGGGSARAWHVSEWRQLVFGCAPVFFWLPALAACVCAARNRRALWVLAPIAMTWALALVVSAFQPRYALNALMLLPLVAWAPLMRLGGPHAVGGLGTAPTRACGGRP